MVIKQLAESEWREVASPVHLCTLPFLPEEFTERFAVPFFEYVEEGLGLCKAAIVEIGGTRFWISAFPDGPDAAKYLTASILSFEPDSLIALKRLLSCLGLTVRELVWCREGLGPAQWSLYRIDDNGNEVEMRRFLEKQSAEWVKARYDQSGHKQAYLVRRST